MKKAIGSLLFVLLTIVSPAFAGPYSDALAKKLVSSTTPEDKACFVRWMFVAMSLHPDIRGLSSVTAEQRDEVNQTVARLITRILTETCVSEAREAIRNEGPGALENAFNVFGSIAGRDLFTNKEVTAGLAGMIKYCDSKALKETLLKNDQLSSSDKN